MLLYTAYGLSIQSELELPELLAAEGNTPPDVVVRLGEIGLSASGNSNGRDTFLVKTEGGDFLIHAGREIVVDPAPGVEEAIARLFLLGPTMAALLRLRGLLVLHASSVAVNDAAIAFLGDAGWGKSTLAEAFCVRGHRLVTDDVMAVSGDSGEPAILPGYPQVKLWPEAAASLGHVPESLPQLHSQVTKRVRRLGSGFSSMPLPLKRLYVLGPASPHHEIVPLGPQEAFMALVRHSWTMSIPNRPDLDVLHFRQCTHLVQQVPARRLKRQASLSALPDLVTLIERDLKSS